MVCSRSVKCLARVKAKNGRQKFCGDKAKFNDLCKKHDKRLQSWHTIFNQEIN